MQRVRNPNSFRLSKLPYLALKLVLQMIDPVQVFELTFMSYSIKFAVTQMKVLQADCVLWKIPQLYRQIPGFDVSITLKNRTFNIRPTRLPIGYAPLRIINTKRVHLKKSGRVFEIYCGKEEAETRVLFETLVRHCVDIFKQENFHLESAVFPFEFEILKTVKMFAQVTVEFQELTLERVKFLFENLSTQKLIFNKNTVIALDGPTHLTLETPEIELDTAEWLSFQSILSMKCKRLIIKRKMDNVGMSHLVEFVRCWVRGGLETLKRFNLKFYNKLEEMGRNKMYREELREKLQELGIRVSTEQDGAKLKIKRKNGAEAEIFFYETFQFGVV